MRWKHAFRSALDPDGQNILASDELAVEKGQPGRHQHDEAGAKQHESRVPSVDDTQCTKLGLRQLPQARFGWGDA